MQAAAVDQVQLLGKRTRGLLQQGTGLVATTAAAIGDENCGGRPPLQELPSSLRVKKLSEHAVLPVRASQGAAGYDLYSAHDLLLPAGGKGLVKTDLAIAVPPGYYGRVAPRSGLSWKHHIDVGAGVIDSDYRGNVGVILFNLSKVDYSVQRGDRVAQFLLQKIITPPVEEVEELDTTERGAGGFGSTGKS